MFDTELQCHTSIFAIHNLALHTLHIRHNVMRTAVRDLLFRMARANSNHCGARRDASLDTRGRILEHDAARSIKAKAFRCEKEWIGEGLSSFQTLVVRRDSHWRWCDANACHRTVS